MGPPICEKCESAIFRISLSGGPATYLPRPVTLAFRASRILLTVGIDIPVQFSFPSYKVMSTVGVDILVNRGFQSYQTLENFKSWSFCSFKSYQKPERHYASRQLSELTTLLFRAIKILSTVRFDIPIDCKFQSYQNFKSYLTPGRHYASSQPSELTT